MAKKVYIDADKYEEFKERLSRYYAALEGLPPDWKKVALAAEDVPEQRQHAPRSRARRRLFRSRRVEL